MPPPVPETVEELLDTVRRLLGDEESRAQSLQAPAVEVKPPVDHPSGPEDHAGASQFDPPEREVELEIQVDTRPPFESPEMEVVEEEEE